MFPHLNHQINWQLLCIVSTTVSTTTGIYLLLASLLPVVLESTMQGGYIIICIWSLMNDWWEWDRCDHLDWAEWLLRVIAERDRWERSLREITESDCWEWLLRVIADESACRCESDWCDKAIFHDTSTVAKPRMECIVAYQVIWKTLVVPAVWYLVLVPGTVGDGRSIGWIIPRYGG